MCFRGNICDWIWVKTSCKSIITMREALQRFTVVLFLGKLIFSGVQGHFYAIFKTLRRLDTTWNFARRVHQGLYTWTRALRTLFVCTEFTKKKVFERLTVAAPPPVRRCHGRQKVSNPECDLTGRRVMVDRSSSLPVRSPASHWKLDCPKTKLR